MDASRIDYIAIAEKWLNQFEKSIATTGTAHLEPLFLSKSYWRDALALTWNIQTICCRGKICKSLGYALKKAGAYQFKLDLSDNPPVLVNRIGTDTIEVFFKF